MWPETGEVGALAWESGDLGLYPSPTQCHLPCLGLNLPHL